MLRDSYPDWNSGVLMGSDTTVDGISLSGIKSRLCSQCQLSQHWIHSLNFLYLMSVQAWVHFLTVLLIEDLTTALRTERLHETTLFLLHSVNQTHSVLFTIRPFGGNYLTQERKFSVVYILCMIFPVRNIGDCRLEKRGFGLCWHKWPGFLYSGNKSNPGI